MTNTITSPTNPKIKTVKRLQTDTRYRRKENSFVVEGTRWITELAQAQLSPSILLATADWLTANQTLLEQWGQSPLIISPQLMQEISDTQTPSGILAVLDQPTLPWPDSPTLLLLLDAIRDPGNMGTLLRTAAAAGVNGTILAPGCVDPFNPKVVRSTMGALLRLPIRRADWSEIEALTGETAVYLAAGEATTPYTTINWTPPATLIIGGEADGASTKARHFAHTPITIPIAHHTESLNAAIAGAIILFEAIRQRNL